MGIFVTKLYEFLGKCEVFEVEKDAETGTIHS